MLVRPRKSEEMVPLVQMVSCTRRSLKSWEGEWGEEVRSRAAAVSESPSGLTRGSGRGQRKPSFHTGLHVFSFTTMVRWREAFFGSGSR